MSYKIIMIIFKIHHIMNTAIVENIINEFAGVAEWRPAPLDGNSLVVYKTFYGSKIASASTGAPCLLMTHYLDTF